eukprot:Gb_17401 [translate_table: standard]
MVRSNARRRRALFTGGEDGVFGRPPGWSNVCLRVFCSSPVNDSVEVFLSREQFGFLFAVLNGWGSPTVCIFRWFVMWLYEAASPCVSLQFYASWWLGSEAMGLSCDLQLNLMASMAHRI